MLYDIVEIKKCEEKISKSLVILYNDIKIIAICGVILFSCEKGLINSAVSDALVVGSVSGSTLGVISLVKSICNIYKNNMKKKELENDK